MTPSGRNVSGSQSSREQSGADPPHPREDREDLAADTLDGGTAIGLSAARDPGESTGRATFEPDEIRRVLAAYPLGEITGIQAFEAGSRLAPKLRISSRRGEYLLKRRVARPELVRRAMFNHGLQLHLEQSGLPVARLVGTAKENRSMLLENERVYEVFDWIEGRRPVRAGPEVLNSGRILGRLHIAGASFRPVEPSDLAGFHAATSVDLAFERTEAAICAADPSASASETRALVHRLRKRLREASARVEDAGWTELPRQPIHGDWHPGNVLFTPAPPTARHPGVVRAIVDFDASRLEPRIVDLANGLLHFAMRSTRDRTPDAWPASLSPTRIRAMISGWKEGVGTPLPGESRSLAPLMVEALIAESIVPIAREGTFAGVPGLPFLTMVEEKARWIDSRTEALAALIDG